MRLAMKIRYLLMTVMVVVATFDGASLALSRRKTGQAIVQQSVLVQPQAEKRGAGEGAIALADWVRWGGKVYRMRQNLPENAELSRR
jgi:hypothetical protein